jgi:hypothetical protein
MRKGGTSFFFLFPGEIATNTPFFHSIKEVAPLCIGTNIGGILALTLTLVAKDIRPKIKKRQKDLPSLSLVTISTWDLWRLRT